MLFEQPDQPATHEPEQTSPPQHEQPAATAAANHSSQPRVWTVKSLVTALTRQVEQQFPDVRVEGEISNLRPAPSGHLYFTLKDGDAQLACVMFRSRAAFLRFRMAEGLLVQARGRASVYESRGQLQLLVDAVEPMGEGAIRLAFEKLRERLQNEGLFDASRKLPLPAFASCLGIITSPTGAVIQDMRNILARRHRGMNVLLYPASVQGANAAREFREGLAWFQSQPRPVDVIVLARGGGSVEDLHCFNDEALARDIAACKIPVVSAIGHETDFTIADFAADLRAPTPSAAAEILTSQHFRLEERIDELDRRIERGFRLHLSLARERFLQLLHSPALRNARDLAARKQQRLDDLLQRMLAAQRQLALSARTNLAELNDRMLRQGLDRRLLTLQSSNAALSVRLSSAMQRRLAASNSRLSGLDAQLHALSPVAILQRGYALVYDAKGGLLSDVSALQQGDLLTTQLANGRIVSTVQSASPTTPSKKDTDSKQ